MQINFARYPSIHAENWRYAFAVGAVRVLETRLLSRSALVQLAGVEGDEQLESQLRDTDYAVEPGAGPLPARLEPALLRERQAARDEFAHLVDDPLVNELFQSRVDFHNLRVALRQALSERDFSHALIDHGVVPTATLQAVFAEERYDSLPEHLRAAVVQAIPAYFEGKNPRQIDFAVDRAQAVFRLKRAREIGSPFLVELARLTADLTNIRATLRVKRLEQERRLLDAALLPGGYVETDMLHEALHRPWDGVAALFSVTPYADVVAGGVEAIVQDESFIRLERVCDDHTIGFLRTTRQIVAGIEPITAYLLAREAEIRNVRMVVSGRHSGLEPSRIIDRVPETY